MGWEGMPHRRSTTAGCSAAMICLSVCPSVRQSVGGQARRVLGLCKWNQGEEKRRMGAPCAGALQHLYNTQLRYPHLSLSPERPQYWAAWRFQVQVQVPVLEEVPRYIFSSSSSIIIAVHHDGAWGMGQDMGQGPATATTRSARE